MSRAALGCFGPAHDVQDGARKVPVREVQHLGPVNVKQVAARHT